MDSILQHLKPASASQNTEAQKQAARMEDLDRRTGASAGGHEIIHSRDGAIYQVPVTLPKNQAELDSFDRDYAATNITTAGMSEQAANAKAAGHMANIEAREAGMGPLNVPLAHPNSPALPGKAVQHVGLLVGMELSAFQVGHRGGDRWRVAGGRVVWERRVENPVNPGTGIAQEVPVDVEGADVTIQDGWIGIWVDIAPLDVFPFGYEAVVGGIVVETSWQFQPPVRSLVSATEEALVTTWAPGRVFIPLAHVQAPGPDVGSPRIVYLRGKSPQNKFSSTTGNYGPGVPFIV